MAARRGERRASCAQIVVPCGIVAETVGSRGEAAAIGLLSSVTEKGCHGVHVFEHIAIGCGIFRLPDVCLSLSYRGVTVVGNTARGIGGGIVALARVGEVGPQTGLQLQLRDDGPFCKTCTDDTGILCLRLGVLQVADGVAYLTVIDIHAGGIGLIVVRAVGIIDRCVWSMGDSGKPVIWGKHAVNILLTRYLIVSGVGIDTNEEVLKDIALIVDTASIALQSSVQDDAVLTLIAAADAVTRDFVATHGRKLVLLLEASL